MALNSTQVQQITDSIAQAIGDFNTAFITNTNSNTPLYSTIVNGVSGTGGSATAGRILGLSDYTSELVLLKPMNTSATNVTSYVSGIRTIAAFYAQFYPVLDALDTATGGLNAFLVTNTTQVNAWFASAFNAYQALAVSLGYRTSANIPTAIATANYFPYAIVDDLWDITSSGATTFSTNAVGTSVSTTATGGGVGQISIYKVNATNATGGATFTITYTKADGTSTTATYTTASGTPTGSGTLASGSQSVSGLIGQAITGVTGTGMTSGEQYRFGMKLVRASAY